MKTEFIRRRRHRLFIRKTLHKPILEAAGLPASRILLKAGYDYAINTREKFATALADIDQTGK